MRKEGLDPAWPHKAERAFGYKESCTNWLSVLKKKKTEIISNLYTSHLLQPTNEMPWFEEGVVRSFSLFMAIFKHVHFPDM